MDREQAQKLNTVRKQARAEQILAQSRGDGTSASIINMPQTREDGYSNVLTKYGTWKDSSDYFQYNHEVLTDDMTLTGLYESNGLFAKIIDRPAEEAVKHGLDIDYGSDRASDYIERRFDELDAEAAFATAEKWARLYGGAIIVMLLDDGGRLEDPVRWNLVRGVDELCVFERAIVQPDYTDLYSADFERAVMHGRKLGSPKYYNVFSIYGYFRVHASRCLLFKNSVLPEQTTNTIYRYFGIPEYDRIKKALQECQTSHGLSVKILERCSQAIYKMNNLASILASNGGDDKVLKRLEVIDMARSILNSIAIDNDGEDYHFESMPLSGVSDIIDETCQMLSAVTNIPQTILFGRSPAGENATGHSDTENYYNMVEDIQKLNMKRNYRILLDALFQEACFRGVLNEAPDYKVEFAPLWNLSEEEQANLDATKANTEKTKADTAGVYIQNQIIDPSEVRKSLEDDGLYNLQPAGEDEGPNIDPASMELPGAEEAAGGQESPVEPVEGITNALNEASAQIGQETPVEDACNNPVTDFADALSRFGHPQESELHEKARTLAGVLARAGQAEGNNRFDGEAPWNRPKDGRRGCALVILNDRGEVLVGQRTDTGEVTGPGGHLHKDEDPADGAIRECVEEFGVLPGPVQFLANIPGQGIYLPSSVYVTQSYTESVDRPTDGEIINQRWMSLDELAGLDNLYPPFRKDLAILWDKRYSGVFRMDGAPPGNQNAAGPHNMGGGANVSTEKKSGEAGEKPTPKKEVTVAGLSAEETKRRSTGANKFSKGFSKKNLDAHWNGDGKNHSHKAEYEARDMDEAQYAARALELIQMPVGGNVLGFVNTDGRIVRYDKETNDYVVGKPDVGIASMFMPKGGEEYFNRRMQKEGGVVVSDEPKEGADMPGVREAHV